MTILALLTLFCDRCGKQFLTAALQSDCPACLYATQPYRVVLGYAQPTPLIKLVGATA